MSYEKLLKYRPENFVDRFGANCKVCALNMKPIMEALRNEKLILMACNTRIIHVIPGIMKAAEELDAVVGFELAKSECNLSGGYTGMTPDVFVQTVVEYAEKIGFKHPFFIHADHITVKKDSEDEIEYARKLIDAQIKAGFTSYAIDASFNEIPINIRITTDLSKPIRKLELGLEVEVGEIKGMGDHGEYLTTVEEAVTYIEGLRDNGVYPQLLAINNGSKHGNYKPGEEVHIDLKRTGEIYDAIKKYGVAIAQHGITGTPLHFIGQFADYGIRKGNVGTHWQNIAHKGLPEDLFNMMKKWAEENNKDIKYATKVFKNEIDNIPEENKKKIEQEAYESAKDFIKAFRAVGSSKLLLEKLT